MANLIKVAVTWAVLLAVTALSGVSYGQEPDRLPAAVSGNARFRHISIEDGLSSSVITSISQDNQGFMWFGTLNGLNRYDGYRMKVYRDALGANDGSPAHAISSIIEAKGGGIWIYAQGNPWLLR